MHELETAFLKYCHDAGVYQSWKELSDDNLELVVVSLLRGKKFRQLWNGRLQKAYIKPIVEAVKRDMAADSGIASDRDMAADSGIASDPNVGTAVYELKKTFLKYCLDAGVYQSWKELSDDNLALQVVSLLRGKKFRKLWNGRLQKAYIKPIVEAVKRDMAADSGIASDRDVAADSGIAASDPNVGTVVYELKKTFLKYCHDAGVYQSWKGLSDDNLALQVVSLLRGKKFRKLWNGRLQKAYIKPIVAAVKRDMAADSGIASDRDMAADSGIASDSNVGTAVYELKKTFLKYCLDAGVYQSWKELSDDNLALQVVSLLRGKKFRKLWNGRLQKAYIKPIVEAVKRDMAADSGLGRKKNRRNPLQEELPEATRGRRNFIGRRSQLSRMRKARVLQK